MKENKVCKRVVFRIALLFFGIPSAIYSAPELLPEPVQGPWFVGPLLTPAVYTVPPGHVNLEPYLYVNNTIGEYNKHWKAKSQKIFTSVSTQVLFTVGLTSFMDIQTFPQVMYNHTSNQSSVRFADLPVQVNFQLCRDDPSGATPDIKLAILESFPTGKFDKLNPEKKGTDSSGDGSYITVLGFLLAKSITINAQNVFRIRSAISYSFPSAVDVKGFNTYGGTYDTKGKVYPGNEFAVLVGLEYSLTTNWALAMDIFGITGKKTKFSGKDGFLEQKTNENVLPFETGSIGGDSFEQLSLAPAFEYSFSGKMGIVAGAWFSVIGRNSAQFANAVAAFNIYF